MFPALASWVREWDADDDTIAKIEKRRNQYKNGFVELQFIPTWYTYYNENRRTLKKQLEGELKRKSNLKLVEVLPELAKKVSVWQGNITRLEIDAIVNSTNKSLSGTWGVDRAVHDAAGPLLKQECLLLRGCKKGEAKITSGYCLPAKYVIHTVGPMERTDGPEVVESCYQKCLKIALAKNLRTIAFPCISTGITGFPRVEGALLAATNIRKFLEKHSDSIDRIIFCVFLPEDYLLYTNIMQLFFPID